MNIEELDAAAHENLADAGLADCCLKDRADLKRMTALRKLYARHDVTLASPRYDRCC